MNEDFKLYPYFSLATLAKVADKAGYNYYELTHKILGETNSSINNICKKLSLQKAFVYNGKAIPCFFSLEDMKRMNEEAERYNNFLDILKEEYNLYDYDAIIVDMSWNYHTF